jgi:acyl-CoA dehydrogenase
MTTYQAPISDLQFVLNDVLRIDRFNNLPGFSDVPSDVLDAILVEAGRFGEEVLHFLNRVADMQGCERNPGGSVTTPDGFRDAFERLGQGGWIGLSAPVEYGGQGLPRTISRAVNEMFVSANMSLEICASLSRGATAALLAHGNEEQKRPYLPKLISGEWTGTMNLTEPHCGTDLGMLRTKAAKQTDDSYQITGTEIFITCGEHDLAQNIIHLVLARIEGALAGIKGVSLFVVPKYLVNADGTAETSKRSILRVDRAQDGTARQFDMRDEL